MATIRIQRTRDFYNQASKYKIFIDGQMVGTIANKEINEFIVSSGQHTVTAKASWGCGSQDIIVDANDDKINTLIVGSGKMWHWMLVILLGPIPSIFTTGCVKKVLMFFPILLGIVYWLTVARKNYLSLEEI